VVGRCIAVLLAASLLAACRGVAPSGGTTSTPLRIVSYNIRHGRGMDDSVNLARTGRVLAALRPDFVGLQEVDDRVRRSGAVDEAAALGTQLGMQHRFGSFMDYQGGRYGLAILSRHPIVGSRVVTLPVGNEPRVALVVDAELPSRDTVSVVTVHFDWVSSDSFRFPQASRLAATLDSLRHPYVVLGDFNDEPRFPTRGSPFRRPSR
jgi:endonuclease/exonuclease/phosphatase family metal-dependent hydrolase